jgi:SAM-dependent methyltransferase
VPSPAVTSVHVDEAGVRAASDTEVVLDVLFDGRRIWSFHLHRDGTATDGEHHVDWPGSLRRFLDGVTQLSVVEHVAQNVVFDDEVRFGTADERIAVVNERGLPLGVDKSGRLAQTFDTRSAEHVAPLLDAVEEVLDALRKAGIDAFPAYGTLLGAVREGKLIGHDSDADLGYVSEKTHPADVMLESFRIQRALADMGYPITRYSGAAFKVDVKEGDGSVRGLDVFGGFMMNDHLYLMGEIGTPFKREWIFPLGTTTLEGRTLPAPANTDEFLTATYGPSWRVPDPAYVFVARQEEGAPLVVDVGCGTGADALFYARRGSRVIGLDYVTRASARAAEEAYQDSLPVEFRHLNLCELRSVLAESARIAREPGTKVVTARHVIETTDRAGRLHLWRGARMMTAAGGRLHLEFLVRRGVDDDFPRKLHLRPMKAGTVQRELEDLGATVLSRKVRTDDPNGRRICRMVVAWQR